MAGGKFDAIPSRDWDDLFFAMGRQKEDLIKFKVTHRVGVDVRRPRWMPEFVWKWMWRQVVVTETPLRFENARIAQ